MVDNAGSVHVSAEEEVEERRWSIVLWADGSSKFDLAVCVVVGVSFIAAGYWQHVWMYIDGV